MKPSNQIREHCALDLVVGARPNLVKVASLIRALHHEDRLTFRLVHTGQHYDNKMSNEFFDVLEIPHEHVNLEVGSSTHSKQTASIMERFEDCLMARRPSMIVVFGDVNSTMACALVAAKLGIPIPTLRPDCEVSIGACRKRSIALSPIV